MSSNMSSAGVHTYEEIGIKNAYYLLGGQKSLLLFMIYEKSHHEPWAETAASESKAFPFTPHA